jgi:hypothetical protein
MARSGRGQTAIQQAPALQGAALVRRLEHGVYAVPSATRAGTMYLVRGVAMDGSDHTCTCKAGQRGRQCWHVEAVRLRRVQEETERSACRSDADARTSAQSTAGRV